MDYCYHPACHDLADSNCECCGRASCEAHIAKTLLQDEAGLCDGSRWLCEVCQERARTDPVGVYDDTNIIPF